MFKLVTHSISTKSKVPTLSDIVKVAQTKAAMASSNATTKTASAAVSTKVASATSVVESKEFELKIAKGKPFGGKAAPLFTKKDKNKKNDSVEVEITDEPVAAKAAVKTKKAATEGGESDEGESSGQLDPAKNPGNDPHKDPKLKAGKSGGKGSKGGESEEGESSGQLDPKANPNNDPKVEGEKKESSNKQWFKIANLTSEQKTDVRKTLEKFWPKKFVDCLLADR